MRTVEEIEELKKQWEYDPIWNIEDTEGFEDHREELLQYKIKREKDQENKKLEQRKKQKESFFNLDLFESSRIEGINYTRVPGGWVYENQKKTMSAWGEDAVERISIACCFIPENKEVVK